MFRKRIRVSLAAGAISASPRALRLWLRLRLPLHFVDRVPRDPLVGRWTRISRERAILQALLRQHLLPATKLLDRLGRVAVLQRAVVALVDRGHRSEVAAAQALEAT